ncbi:tRNA pseudouridine(55) synthase TruB [Desulfovibrio sp. OttesenSCG-928-I05]|nr:tRNA pseudouridine(55) synthase TruB [Desulfovibrio sp. OttesenSCG-928-I05]
MKAFTTCAQQDGILVVNKPSGPTSAACIAKIKRQLGQKKIGHAGTLDPMASGVLLVLLGQATKLSGHLMAAGEKIYAGTLRLGEATDTWDAEGTVTERRDASHVTEAMLADGIASWIGETEQEVPPYSAAKHQGKPLYELARKGLETPVKTKTVRITSAEIQWVDFPHCRFRVACGSGTYIRSLAHSLGIRLGCGATLTELTREYSHPFGLDSAHDLDTILGNPDRFAECVTPLHAALPNWPLFTLSGDEEARVKNGMRIPFRGWDGNPAAGFDPGATALMQNADGVPVALAECGLDNGAPAWVIIRGLWN